MLSYVPQLWLCSSGTKLENNTACSWRGDYPVAYVTRFEPDLIEFMGLCDHPDVHPTCPKCGGHRFMVKDLPIKKK